MSTIESNVLTYAAGDIIRFRSGNDVITGHVKDVKENRFRIEGPDGTSQWIWQTDVYRHATTKEASDFFNGISQ